MNYWRVENKDLYPIFVSEETESNTQAIIEYDRFIDKAHPYRKEGEIIQYIPEGLDFLKATSKPPKHIIFYGSSFPRGFLISKELLSEFKEWKLPKHIISPIKFIYRKKWVEHFVYIYFLENGFKYCDVKKCVFYSISADLDEEEICFASREDFLTKEAYLRDIHPRRIILKNTYPEYDAFGLYMVDKEIYFSDRVKKRIETLKIPDISFISPRFILRSSSNVIRES